MTDLNDEYAARHLIRPSRAAHDLGVDRRWLASLMEGRRIPSASFMWNGTIRYGIPEEAFERLLQDSRNA